MKNPGRIIFFGILSVAAVLLSACNAALPAGAEAKVSADGQSAQVEFTGVVDSIAADQWVVSGQILLVNTQTIIDGTFAAGDSVKVNATVTSDGAVTADKIESSDNNSGGNDSQATPDAIDSSKKEFTGTADAIGADEWTVGGQLFQVNAQTEIKGNIQLGDMVKVHFVNNTDGTFTATEIELAAAQGQDDSKGLEITGKVEAFAPEAWTVKGQVFAVNAQTEIKGTILLGDVVKLHYVVNADGTFSATEIELAGDNQAHNSEKKLTGELQELTPTQATIGGVVVLITPQTVLDSGLIIGNQVKAEVITSPDGVMTALKIETFNNSKVDDKGGLNSGSDNSGSGSNNGSGKGGSDDHKDKTPEPGDDHGGDD
jgi:hypothetical protein